LLFEDSGSKTEIDRVKKETQKGIKIERERERERRERERERERDFLFLL